VFEPGSGVSTVVALPRETLEPGSKSEPGSGRFGWRRPRPLPRQRAFPTLCRRRHSRAGMILPWIRRGSGFGAASSRAFPAQCCRGPYCGRSGGCAPTATTRRYHE
jgi:hypothetical protein